MSQKIYFFIDPDRFGNAGGKEMLLRKLVEATKEDVYASRDIHKKSLIALRGFYNKSLDIEKATEAQQNTQVFSIIHLLE